VGTSLKIPGTKRITRESINAVHHTPRGKAIWINLDPPPTKDFDIWIKGDCQLLPTLYEDYQLFTENEKSAKVEEIKRKEEEKVRVVEERMEKKAREQARKEELALERERRKERKEREKEEKIRREEERKRRKEEKEAEKKRRELERAIRPSKKKVKVNGEKWARPLTPPLSYDTDSTLSSPSLSDLEFASLHESTPRTTPQKTPKKNRIIEYLPTPAATPQKGSQIQEQDSPLKKRSLIWMHDSNKKPRTSEGNGNGQRRDSMSIRFLTEDSD
jgi:flagellar biosynthesis GTPase FlhF